ncbi:Acetophenone carboxylase subunit Apc1 [Patulibacter medicamentivorans]|uniref:Acetophenone carboxylase subunit Apc1 n=1 Tax=Patulibacter medicamentivorans TaxID=1097667 RepID=H0E091_9ACTN|nr:hydantoinase/oxoprolinase family protein [Patulibacter medicamentivorans]EHN12894.1 Acetophenone carboxylase subunit Apc1 [Patulibacter medicamentivorans]
MVATDNRITIDIDTGGTFTDGVVSTGAETWPIKVLTTPHDLTIALRELIGEAAGQVGVDEETLLQRVDSIRYSTTLGTNTLIERSGPRIGLLVNAGGAAAVAAAPPGSLVADILDPVEHHLRRIDLSGDETTDAEPVLQAVEELLDGGAERLVIVLDDQAAEEQVRRIVFDEYPRHILGALPVLFGGELTSDPDLARRVATSLLNAYLHPQLETFLYEAESVLRARGLHRPLFVFCNDGTTNRVAKVTALKTHNSGPAGGVEAAAALARHYGLGQVATIDIGGTSTDVAFLTDARIEERRRGGIEGTECSMPMRKIDALGGGGGTIAEVGADGRLQLGPRSAGAAPGPACFGFGGTDATVTDANLTLGVFDPEQRFAGRVALDPERARNAIQEHVAGPLGLSAEAAADRVRVALEERIGGYLRDGLGSRGAGERVLIAFGGGGAVHAARIAEHAGIDRVLVPGLSSVCSAFGIGFADVEHRYERVVPGGGEQLAAEVERELTERARIDMRGEGFSLDDVVLDVARGEDDEGRLTVGLTARAPLPHLAFAATERPTDPPTPSGERDVWWDGTAPRRTPIYADADVRARNARIAGPAIVAGDIVTVCVPPGWALERDAFDQSFLTREA